jgi:hypothetical protein
LVTVVGGGVTLGASVSFLQATKKAEMARINSNFFIRLKCFKYKFNQTIVNTKKK